MSDDLKQAKILFNTLLKAKLDSSPEYQTYEQIFFDSINLVGGIDIILQSFKSDVMQKKHEACYTLAKIYEIGFYNQPKDEYTSMLLTSIGFKLENREYIKIVQSNTTQYEIFEDIADNFINNYLDANTSLSFDDAILEACCPMLGGNFTIS